MGVFERVRLKSARNQNEASFLLGYHWRGHLGETRRNLRVEIGLELGHIDLVLFVRLNALLILRGKKKRNWRDENTTVMVQSRERRFSRTINCDGFFFESSSASSTQSMVARLRCFHSF